MTRQARYKLADGEAAIYALQDAETDLFVYVGQSKTPYNRFHQHVHRLKASGGRLRLVLLEITPDNHKLERERHWINHYKSLGHPLRNIGQGGPRPGSGRPTRNKDGKPTISSSVAFDPDDLTWLDEQTTKRGLSVSAIIALALACLRKHPEEWPK